MIILLFLPLFSLNPWYTLYNAVPSHIRNVADSMGFYIMVDFWVRKTTCGQDGGCVGGWGGGEWKAERDQGRIYP